METRVTKTERNLRLGRYISQLTKSGVLGAARAAALMEAYNRNKDIGAVQDELVMLAVPEEKESVYRSVIDALFGDKILNN